MEYSAGLIDYFFRGELGVYTPENFIYAMLDGGDAASTCANTCGFKKLKAKVLNLTSSIYRGLPLQSGPPPIGSTFQLVPQPIGTGKLVAVVKYSLNRCYQSDWSGDPGPLNPSFDNTACLLAARDPVSNAPIPLEEQVVSAPISIAGLPESGSTAIEFAFDFTAQPIPVNAWNIRLQVVFRGKLGDEEDGIATGITELSAPSVYRMFNESDWFIKKAQPAPPSNDPQSRLAPLDSITTPEQAALITSSVPYFGYCINNTYNPTTLRYQYTLQPWLTPVSFPTEWSIFRVSSPPLGVATLNALPPNSATAYVVLGSRGTGSFPSIIQRATLALSNPPFPSSVPANSTGAAGFPSRNWYVDASSAIRHENAFLAYRGVQFNGAVSRNAWGAENCGYGWNDLYLSHSTTPFSALVPASDYDNRPRIGNPAVKMTTFNF